MTKTYNHKTHLFILSIEKGFNDEVKDEIVDETDEVREDNKKTYADNPTEQYVENLLWWEKYKS